jgi:hypothetical protein
MYRVDAALDAVKIPGNVPEVKQYWHTGIVCYHGTLIYFLG